MQRSPHDIVVFTGAGISASAGLKTYRGPGGLWTDSRIVQASLAETVTRDPALCWEHWGGLRGQIKASGPTRAHFALAAAEARLPEDYSLHIVTQNVDGLHTQAGSKNVIEFHGNVFNTRCSNARCKQPSYIDHETHSEGIPHCTICGAVLRPGIVLFGEQIDGPLDNGEVSKVTTARQLFKRAGTVVVVGTTLEVMPAKNVVDIKKRFYSGVHTVWINVEPMRQYQASFREKYTAAADDVLPGLLERLIPLAV